MNNHQRSCFLSPGQPTTTWSEITAPLTNRASSDNALHPRIDGAMAERQGQQVDDGPDGGETARCRQQGGDDEGEDGRGDKDASAGERCGGGENRGVAHGGEVGTGDSRDGSLCGLCSCEGGGGRSQELPMEVLGICDEELINAAEDSS